MGAKDRYWPILKRFKEFQFSEAEIRYFSSDFELALNDLQACKNCKAKSKEEMTGLAGEEFVTDAKTDKTWKEEVTVFHIPQCRSSSRKGFYYDLDWRSCCEYGKIMFCYKACPGPYERLKQIQQDYVYKGEHQSHFLPDDKAKEKREG